MLVSRPNIFLLHVLTAAPLGLYGHEAQALDEHKGTGWTLSQLSRLSGRQIVKFDKNHARLESPKTGTVSLLVGPPWKMYFFNPRKKLVFGADFANLGPVIDEGFTGGEESDVIEGTPMKEMKGAGRKVASLNTRYFFMHDSKAFRQLVTRRRSGYRETLSGLPAADAVPLVQAEYWVAADIKVPMQVSKFICKVYKMPFASGVPLRYKAKDVNGHTSVELDTFSCSLGKFKPDEFVIPKGYHRAKSYREFVFDEGAQNQALQMMQGLMDADEAAKKSRSRKK